MSGRKRSRSSNRSGESTLAFMFGAGLLISLVLSKLIELADKSSGFWSELSWYEWTLLLLVLAGGGYGLLRYRSHRRWSNREADARAQERWELERRQTLRQLGTLHNLKEMEPLMFQRYMKELFMSLGYSYEQEQQAVSDDSDHLLLLQKDTQPIAAACRQYDAASVNRAEIVQLYQMMVKQKARQGIFVTTGEFCKQAIDYAEGKPIQLVDGVMLMQWIEQLEVESEQTEMVWT